MFQWFELLQEHSVMANVMLLSEQEPKLKMCHKSQHFNNKYQEIAIGQEQA